MLENYLKVAIQALFRNKLYAAINIIGLSVGLAVFIFAYLLTDYENTHDTNFANHERIYTLGTRFASNANLGVLEMGTTHSAFAPFVKDAFSEVVATVRTKHQSFVASIEDKHFHEDIKFAEADLLRLFDFTYISGDATALVNPNSVLLTKTAAEKWFGRTDVFGETVIIDGDYVVNVSAVIEDPEVNTHFNSLLVGQGFSVVMPYEAQATIFDFDTAGNWQNLSAGDVTYLMTDIPLADTQAFEEQINELYFRQAPVNEVEDLIASIRVRKLPEMNTVIWDLTGLPVISSVFLLGTLILIIAIVNYTNLAVAQSLSRTREVGLRKTMGSSKRQLMLQFLIESIFTSVIAMCLALAIIENMVPLFNELSGKVITLEYASLIPFLAIVALITGLLAGAYPSILITRVTTLSALKDTANKGQSGTILRSIMIGVQFTLSIFMLSVVTVAYFQTMKVKEASNIFPKDEVLVLERIATQEIYDNRELIKQELSSIPGVSHVSFTSMPPFVQSNSQRFASVEKGDSDNLQKLNFINADYEFLDALDIPLVAGRNFSRDITGDARENFDIRVSHVIVSELTLRRLGITSPEEAIGMSLWGGTPQEPELESFEYKIIGVIADRNYQGLHNGIKPWIISINPRPESFALLRIEQNSAASVLQDVENAWAKVVPNYPLEYRFLNAVFQDIYVIYELLNSVMAGFAFLALTLALIGLFGLAAFMAKGRTREIGLRKVMGASAGQIIRLLLWQFSKPVLWAILIAFPVAYVATNQYLSFFVDRITSGFLLILLAGLTTVVLAAIVISVHALKVAKANPINALRYE